MKITDIIYEFVGKIFIIFFVISIIFWILTLICFIPVWILKNSKDKIMTLIKMNVFLIFIILLFYYFFPILENKELRLGNVMKIRKEPLSAFRIYPIKEVKIDVQFLMYLKKLKKYGNNWVGYIYNCDEIIYEGIPYKDIEPMYSSDDLTDERCKILEDYSGLFFINENQEIEYHLSAEEIKKRIGFSEIKLKDPNDYIQKYGIKKEINETYFSVDRTVRMQQTSLEIREKMIFIRNILYSFSIGTLAVLCYLKKFKISKKKRLRNEEKKK